MAVDTSDAMSSAKSCRPFVCNSEALSLLHEEGWKYEYEAMLIEVKGPTDHLSKKQIIWLKHLCMHNVKSSVALVREKKKEKVSSV
jgi:hypothetical protein